jgi:hypothetical protein
MPNKSIAISMTPCRIKLRDFCRFYIAAAVVAVIGIVTSRASETALVRIDCSVTSVLQRNSGAGISESAAMA